MANTPDTEENTQQRAQAAADGWKTVIEKFQAIGKDLENPDVQFLWTQFEEQAMPALKGVYGDLIEGTL
jgi:hypothetical protein